MKEKLKSLLTWDDVRRILLIPAQALKSQQRSLVLGSSVFLAVLFIAVASIIFPKDSFMAVFLLDHSSNSIFPYPFTIQITLILFFFVGLGELALRWTVAQIELDFPKQGYLPEDEQTVLQTQDLGAIRQKVAGRFDAENGFLPYLINLCILQFQSSRSVDQTVSVMNSSLELMSHRVDLRYSMIRYIVWAIPTIGFIGTVVGIAGALGYINPDHMDLGLITGNLKIAFNTTILALLFSAILVWIQHVVQKREEMGLNLAGHYCLQNLINRLFVGP